MISSEVCIIKQPLNPALSTTFKSTREAALRKNKRPRKRKYWATFFEHDIRGKHIANSSLICGKSQSKKCKFKQKKKNSRNQKAQHRKDFRNFNNSCCCHCSCSLMNKPTIEQSSAEHLHQISLNLPESTDILNTNRKREHVSTLLFHSLVTCGKHRAVVHLSDTSQYAANKFLPKISTNDIGVISARETHQIAEAQQQKNAKLRVAFGIPEYFVEGTSFDPDRNAKELLTESLALQDELQIQRETEKQKNRKYTFARTPSPENNAESARRNKEKRKKKKKHSSISLTSEGKKERRKKSKKHKKSRSKNKNQKRTKDIPTDKAEDNGNTFVSDDSEGLTHHKKKKKRERKTKNKKHTSSEDSHTNSPHSKSKGSIDGKRCEGERLSRLDEHRKRTSKKVNMLHIREKGRRSYNNLGRHSDSSDSDHSVNNKRPRKVFAEEVTDKHSASKRKSPYTENIQSTSNKMKENKDNREKSSDRRNSSQSVLRKRNKRSRSFTRSRSPTDKRSSNTHSNLQKSSSSKERTPSKSRLHKKNFTTGRYLASEICGELNNRKTDENSNSPSNRINIQRTNELRRFDKYKKSTSKSPPIHTSLISESKIPNRSRDKFTFSQNHRGGSLYHTSSGNRTYVNSNRRRSSSKSRKCNSHRWASEKESLMQSSKNLTSMRGSDKIKQSIDKTKSKLESSFFSLENTSVSNDVKILRSEEERPQFSMQTNTLQNDIPEFQDILQTPCSSIERKKHSLKRSNENIEKKYQHFTRIKDRASKTESKNPNEHDYRLIQKNTVEKKKKRSLSTSSESSVLSYSPARRDPEQYRTILEEIKKENKLRLEKIASPRWANYSSNRSRSKEYKHSTQLQQPVVRLHSPNESDVNDSGKEERNEENLLDVLVNEKKTDCKNHIEMEMEMLEALKSGIAAKAKEKIKCIEKMATEVSQKISLANTNLLNPLIIASIASSHRNSLEVEDEGKKSSATIESTAHCNQNSEEKCNSDNISSSQTWNPDNNFKTTNISAISCFRHIDPNYIQKPKIIIKPFKINEPQQVTSISLPLNDSSLVEAIVAKVAGATTTTVVATAVTSERQLRSRSRSKNKCSRSDSKSSYSSSRSRGTNSSKSGGSSSSSSGFSRSSYSRSSSVSSSDNSKSRSCSGARSPSIPRRRGSPSFLDRRRITSARKRPIPYHRQTSSSLSSGGSFYSNRNSWSRSPFKSPSKSRSPVNNS